MSKDTKEAFKEHDDFATGLTDATHAAFGGASEDPKALAKKLKERAGEARDRLADSVEETESSGDRDETP